MWILFLLLFLLYHPLSLKGVPWIYLTLLKVLEEVIFASEKEARILCLWQLLLLQTSILKNSYKCGCEYF